MLHASHRTALWSIFLICFFTAFWQYFEFAYTLWQNGLISSPVWSGTFGAPVLHHGYWGFIGAGASVTAIEWSRRRSHRHKSAD